MPFLLKTLERFIPSNSINLTLKHQCILILASFVCVVVGITVTAYFQTFFHLSPTSPLLVASLGASLVILFFAPQSHFAQPWAFVGGQFSCACIGVLCERYIPSFSLSCAIAVSGGMVAMLVLRCLHPPGIATALTPVISGISNFNFIWLSVGLNIFITLIIVIVVNRWCLKSTKILSQPKPKSKTTRKKKR